MATQLAQKPDSLPAQPKRMGRPPIKSEAMFSAVMEQLANGKALAEICRQPGMPGFSTVWQWAREDENFAAAITHAREIGTHHMADDCIRIADDAALEPNDRKVRIETRLRLIGQWNRAVYGAHSRTEITGKDGGAIEITDNSAQLQALAQTLRQAKRSSPPLEGEVIRKADKKTAPIDPPVERIEHQPEDISDLI